KKSIQRSDEQRNLYKTLFEAYEFDKIILDTYGETVTLKRRRDDDADKDEEPSVGPDRGSKRRREGKEPESASAPKEKETRSAGKSTQGSKSHQASASESALAEEPMQTTSQMEEPSHPEFDTNRDWNKTLPAIHGSIQPWISELAKQPDSRSSFNELMDTPLDFSNFLINRLKVDTLTPELLAGPTYELMKGSCKSLVELEDHLEEVFKATTDQLDWVNPEGQQYPHNLLKPLPLIPNNRGRRVILFEHFINNGLEYLRGECLNCVNENGKPLTCNKCGGMLRGGFCFPCNFEAENSYNCYQDAYSFDNISNNSNHFPQPRYENYLCNLCGNNSHDGYDCQQQFPFIYEQEPSYNQNYDDNYYPYESPSFLCCDNCGGSHETFQCQPMAQNIDFFGSDQIQTPQYPDVHPPSPEQSNEVFQAKGDLMNILEDLKELAEYEKSKSRDRPIFLNDDSDQNKECFENPSDEIDVSNFNEEKEEPPQDSDIHQLIEECSTKVSEEQKQSMEDTMLEFVKICQEKEFLCIHDNVDDLIGSALNTKLLSINSQHLDNEKQEVKNVIEQPAERRNRIESLQNFRVIRKSSISLNYTSQISSIHAVTTILSTKEPEHSLSMGYEHLSITPETESDEVTESNAENLLPIPSECEITSDDEIECDMPAKDNSSLAFTTFSNPLFNDNDDLDSSDDESLPDEDVSAEEFKVYSNPLFDEDEINSDKLDPHCFNVESDFVESLLNRDTFIDSSSKFDFSGELAHVNPEIKESDFDFEEEIRLIENLLYDNSYTRPPEEFNVEIANTIVESIPSLPIPVQDGDSQREEIDVVTEMDDVLSPSVENNDDSSNDPLLEEAELFLFDNSIPSGNENVTNDSKGDVRFLEELLIDDYILSHESSDSNFEDIS
nr:hypothetical protein [Tanacetum cinerariifolium]